MHTAVCGYVYIVYRLLLYQVSSIVWWCLSSTVMSTRYVSSIVSIVCVVCWVHESVQQQQHQRYGQYLQLQQYSYQPPVYRAYRIPGTWYKTTNYWAVPVVACTSFLVLAVSVPACRYILGCVACVHVSVRKLQVSRQARYRLIGHITRKGTYMRGSPGPLNEQQYRRSLDGRTRPQLCGSPPYLPHHLSMDKHKTPHFSVYVAEVYDDAPCTK